MNDEVDNKGGFRVLEKRLDGIESELRELRGLMTQLVRVEERGIADRAEMARLSAELVTLRGALDKMRGTVDSVQAKSARTSWAMSNIERLFWLAVAGAIAWWSK
jgi:uncharacterized protein HemX